MPLNTTIKWFSGKQDTIEGAQGWYKYDLFNPAAVFELPDGGFVLAYLQEQEFPPHKTAQEIERLVDSVDPIFKLRVNDSPRFSRWRLSKSNFQAQNGRHSAF